MEDLGILTSMAEGAITLAGFAAVFRAFAGGYDPDGHSRVRLNSVIEGGLAIAFVCYLPAWLVSAGFTDSTTFRLPSGIIIIWGLARIAVPTSQILRSGARLPELFRSVVAAGIVALLAAVLNVVGISPISAYSTHLLATTALFANVGLIFVAQFRAEQVGRDGARAQGGSGAHPTPGERDG